MATTTETVQMRNNIAEVVWSNNKYLSNILIKKKNSNLFREVRTAGPGNGHVPLHRHAAVAADRGHDGQVGHEVRDAAEVVSEHPVSTTRYDRDNHSKVSILIFHENKVEGAVKCCVNQVSQTKIEDEDVCDTSHLPVF